MRGQGAEGGRLGIAPLVAFASIVGIGTAAGLIVSDRLHTSAILTIPVSIVILFLAVAWIATLVESNGARAGKPPRDR